MGVRVHGFLVPNSPKATIFHILLLVVVLVVIALAAK